MVDTVTDFLAHSPLLLLFAVIALGYPISKIRVAGASFGIASVLFAGVFLGAIVVDPALDPAVRRDLAKEMKLVYELGLAVFVYAMGLAIAHSFWAAFSREGLKKNAVVLTTMVVSTAVVVILARTLGFNARYAAGLLTGAFTNMPALAGVVERVRSFPGLSAVEVAQPTVAAAIAYPVGVLVPMVALLLGRRLCRVNLQEEARGLQHYNAGLSRLVSQTVRVTLAHAVGMTHSDLRDRVKCKVVFGRLLRGRDYLIAPLDVKLEFNDLLVIVGSPDDVERATRALGETADVALENDVSEVDSTRVFVSRWDVVGKPLRELQLPERYNGIITRLRRGDMWFVPDSDTVLELGDRIRVATFKENISKIEELFGDSYRELSEVSFLTFAMGLAVGLALGQIPIPLGQGIVFKLGFAGGPLLVALALGRFHRIGPFIWNFPYSANHTVRQLGLTLFAAGIGVMSGEGFRAIVAGNLLVLPLFLGVAVLIAAIADTTAVVLGYVVFKIPLNVLFGIVAGIHTQPVVLGFANQQTGNELPNVGFATVYPLATILKIVLAQALLILAA